MSPLPPRPSALRFLRDHPPMILGVIALHLLALHALVDSRRQPAALPFDLRPSMTVLDPVVVPPPPAPAPPIEPTAAPSPAPETRRSARANAAPARSTAVRQVDRSAGVSAVPAAPAASDAEARQAAEAAPAPLDPAATARAIADVARHPLLPGATHAAPMNFGDKLARDLGSDDHVSEEHLDNGVIRLRSGSKCLLSSPSRTADPFTQANASTPRLTTSCD